MQGQELAVEAVSWSRVGRTCFAIVGSVLRGGDMEESRMRAWET